MSTLPSGHAQELGPLLRELALDLHWSWNHASDEVWRRIDPELWEATRNPWLILNTASGARIGALHDDRQWIDLVETLISEKRQREQSSTWFAEAHPASALRSVAYLSMEYMLAEALPIYAGGLGNVAGDQLKAASDLGIPVTAVGLLYSQGYFRQAVRADGRQEALYPVNDPGQLPLRPVRTADDEWLRIRLDWLGVPLTLRTWEVQVGRCRLYLLDTNDPANLPAQRCITGQLYGGDAETRLQQEIVLGIGGWRLLRALGIDPEICHLNEGHAAFAALERAADFRHRNDCSFDEALTATRAGNVFTTHTAVAAGFDRFQPALIERHLEPYARHALGIPFDELLALGRREGAEATEPFNMALLAIRASAVVSGVSALHEQVTRQIVRPFFPRWPDAELPVRHVTNGIHVPSWDGVAADRLWTEVAGRDRWRGELDGLADRIRDASDQALWQLRSDSRAALVAGVRWRHARARAAAGARDEEVTAAGAVFDPGRLTLGFARRFATYKRPNLLLQDPDRLERLLLDTERPVQLVVAGKAHPADPEGQALVAAWSAFAERPALRSHVVFLADYDMLIAEELVQGVDVWINTPRRPWEASGTSGMKLLANGGLNLSELDGWWAEAYTPAIGWAIGDGQEHGDDPAIDREEAEQLYGLLEREIVPAFYERDAHGRPAGWIGRIRESVALAPRFSSNRSVREYLAQHYLPCADAYLARAADGGRQARDLARTLANGVRAWPEVRFDRVELSGEEGAHVVRASLVLGRLRPDQIDVELYAEAAPGAAGPERVPMTFAAAADEVAWFEGTLPSGRPTADWTPRAMLHAPGLARPLEAAFIRWVR